MNDILDEFWKWYLATGKALLFSLLCGIHLLAMVLFEIAWNLFRVTRAARDYIEAWSPVRPQIFELRNVHIERMEEASK